MKQKLALAQAFADPVEILILDEPTSALDPSARGLVLELVLSARANGQTVVFSGHVLSEVEQVADRVAIMRRGRLMHVEDMHQRRRNARLLLLRFENAIPEVFPDDLELSVRERNGETVLLEHRGAPVPLLSWLATQPISDLAIGTEDLRSLYDQYHGPNADKDEEVAG
jgi:ABC-2 type transport system ATP-binding protein